MNTHRLIAYAPIHEFRWSGEDFQVGSGLWVKRLAAKPDLLGLESSLSRFDANCVSDAHHWLIFEVHGDSEIDKYLTEVRSFFLLSLWLSRATATQVRICFLIDTEPQAARQSVKPFSDSFALLPGDRLRDFSDTDIRNACSYYPALWSVYGARKRLNDALLLTIAGCVSQDWRAALICHSAAVEAMLTYATGRGITRRLAMTCACLLEADKVQRDGVFRNFCKLYDARSDIMHGRTYQVPESERLETLRQYQELLRRLWCKALLSPPLNSILEGSDAVRAAYFQSAEHGYMPPAP